MCPYNGIRGRFFGMQRRWFVVVASILGIRGATGGRTVGALSGDQRIPHVFEKSAKRFNSYVVSPSGNGWVFGCQTVPIGWGKVIIWLSDSPNWAWQVGDSLSELIHTNWWQPRWTHCVSRRISVDLESIQLLALQPQGERKRWQWTGQAIRYAPGLYLDHGQGGGAFQRWLYFIYTNTWSYCYWRSTGLWADRLDVLPKSGSSYRAAGSDRGKHLKWWDRHQALDGRAGSSGGNGQKEVSRGILV